MNEKLIIKRLGKEYEKLLNSNKKIISYKNADQSKIGRAHV